MKQFLNTELVNNEPITDYLEVVVHMFPLPYHHNAFFVTILVPLIYDYTGHSADKVFEYMEFMLRNQAEFLPAKSYDLNEEEVKVKICASASHLEIISYDECLKGINDMKYFTEAKSMWKYAAYNGIDGTPEILLNGIQVDVPYTITEWRAMLQGHLGEIDTGEI